jgi:hypothetical protein
MKGKRMVSKFGNCFGRKKEDSTDSEEMEELTPEEEDQYETLGTIEEVVHMSFQKSGVNRKLVKYALEAVRIGLIEIVSNEMIIRKSQEAFLNVDLVTT